MYHIVKSLYDHFRKPKLQTCENIQIRFYTKLICIHEVVSWNSNLAARGVTVAAQVFISAPQTSSHSKYCKTRVVQPQRPKASDSFSKNVFSLALLPRAVTSPVFHGLFMTFHGRFICWQTPWSHTFLSAAQLLWEYALTTSYCQLVNLSTFTATLGLFCHRQYIKLNLLRSFFNYRIITLSQVGFKQHIEATLMLNAWQVMAPEAPLNVSHSTCDINSE